VASTVWRRSDSEVNVNRWRDVAELVDHSLEVLGEASNSNHSSGALNRLAFNIPVTDGYDRLVWSRSG
jgi:hypothetical protein